MPKYNFSCERCSFKTHKYVSVSTETVPCDKCGEPMQREFPNTNSPTEVREVVDPYTNRKWGKDHAAVMKDRRDTYYWENEVPRLVEKYSVETCLEQGWLKYNDKGELVINKPPKKR